jgi:hypothetical protein
MPVGGGRHWGLPPQTADVETLADGLGWSDVQRANDHECRAAETLVGKGVVAHQTADDCGVDVGRRACLRGGPLLKCRVGGN